MKSIMSRHLPLVTLLLPVGRVAAEMGPKESAPGQIGGAGGEFRVASAEFSMTSDRWTLEMTWEMGHRTLSTTHTVHPPSVHG